MKAFKVNPRFHLSRLLVQAETRGTTQDLENTSGFRFQKKFNIADSTRRRLLFPRWVRDYAERTEKNYCGLSSEHRYDLQFVLE
jgi:hypothetical protein